jgi:hypothetical protein
MATSYIERGNFINVQSMVASLVMDLQARGFKVLNINDSAVTAHPTTVDSTVKRVLLAATEQVDPLAIEDGATMMPDGTTPNPLYDNRQPWRFVIEVNSEGAGGIPLASAKGWINWYVCTPTNIIDADGEFKVAISKDVMVGTNRQVSRTGLLTTNSIAKTPNGKDWIHPDCKQGTDAASWAALAYQDRPSWRYEHFGFYINRQGTDVVNEESIPLTYALSTTDHGVAFMMWTEARDNTGDRFHWWTVQRMVDKDTGQTILGNETPGVVGKSPLFCVFSMAGGGDLASSLGDDIQGPDLLDAFDDVYYFVVRESDVHTPTVPVTACFDTNDSSRIINVMQQVSISENNDLTMNMIKGLSTQRYSYPHELDMITYISADVVSQFAEVEVNVYNEMNGNDPHKRVYKALKANRRDNKGMRLMFLKAGGDLPAPVTP